MKRLFWVLILFTSQVRAEFLQVGPVDLRNGQCQAFCVNVFCRNLESLPAGAAGRDSLTSRPARSEQGREAAERTLVREHRPATGTHDGRVRREAMASCW